MPCFARGFAAAALLLAAATASALTINFDYVKPGSDPFVPSVTRPDDPDGARLLAHAEAAADDWSRVIQDNWTMNIELYYADEPIVGTTTASIRPDFQTLEFNGKNRVISGTIRVFDEIDAFYDPTPSEDSEFGAPIESLYRDALPINAATIRVESGDASLLELGYRRPGNSNVSVHEWDLLTIMRHELGHYMGFNQRSPDDPDRDDGDFDVDPDLLGGAKVGITGAGHIHPAGPLMSVTQDPRSRNEISATDFFAAAKGSGWENLHLERVDYLGPASGPTNFTIGTNWTGGAAPDPAAAVSIRNGGLLSVITDEVIGSLVVDRGSQMNLINAELLVAEGLVVGRQSASNDTEGQVSVIGSATLSARSVKIEVGQLGLTLGTLRSRFGAIENDATLTGYGQINTAGGLTNRGALRATVGTLTITGPTLANPVADLDGGNRFAVVEAITGSLDVQIDNDAGFRGRMTIGGGEFVHLPNDWTLGNLGKLQLQGGASQEAELRGGDLTATNAELTVTGRGRIAANLSITSNSDVAVTPANARLTVAGNLDLNRGTITGAGGLIVQETLTASNGTIDVDVLTLGQTATIDGASVTASDITGAVRLDEGSLAFDTFQGELLQRGGFLDAGSKASHVNGDWSQDGGGTLGVQITGDNDFGQLLVSGDAVIDGLIEVALLGGYEPDLLRSFTIVQAGKLVIESLGLTGPDAQHFELQVNGDTLRLIAVVPLPGDYNDDGTVDAADYTVWRDNLGGPAGTLPNDNAGGSIGTAQYNAWRANFGATLDAPSAATPEPAALLLSSIALLATAGRRRDS